MRDLKDRVFNGLKARRVLSYLWAESYFIFNTAGLGVGKSQPPRKFVCTSHLFRGGGGRGGGKKCRREEG